MRGFVKGLYRSYRAYHEANPSLLQWIGVVGFTGLSALYLVRLTGKLPPRWDDVYFRVPAILLCFVVALGRWWPPAARRFYLPYSYITVFYCLAFFLPLTLLQNRAATNTVVNMVIGAVLIILLTDWRNTIVMILGGYAASVACYWLINDQPEFPLQFLYWWLPLCLVLGAGGSISKYVEKRGELERLRRLYSGLAGSIAHEVRNPLLQVQHVLDTIDAALAAERAGAGQSLAAERAAAVRQALEQGRGAVARGLQAILVTLQQLNPSAFDPSKFRTLSAVQCARKAAAEYAYGSEAERGKVTVKANGDFQFHGEETVFVLILFNLLKNALYYLPVRPESCVTVTVEGATRRIVVLDTGPGIPHDLQPRLFEEFHSAGKAEGTGLGLAFCKRAMHAFGGSISCRSEPGQFTEFTLAFPELEQAEPAGAREDFAAATSVAGTLAGRTVLVVDDQALNRAAARAQLAALGAQVLEAEHGQQAIELLRDGALPDAILMDVNMPGMNGIEATRAIRALPGRAAGVPVIALTANVSADVLAGAPAAGMHEVLAKPIDVARLMEVLGPLLDPSPPPRARAAPADDGTGLLNTARIEGLRQLGLLQELVPGMLGEIRRLAGIIREGVAEGDRKRTEEALHTLVGLSGETGAQALHACAKRHYRSMLSQALPPDGGWVEELQSLMASTEQAVLLQYGLRAAPAQTSSHSLRV